MIGVGANVNIAAQDGATCLHVASELGHGDLVSLLLRNGANPNVKTSEGLSSLHMAAKSGQVECTQLLLAHRAIVNAGTNKGATPLHLACRANQKGVVDTLLQAKADPDATMIVCTRQGKEVPRSKGHTTDLEDVEGSSVGHTYSDDIGSSVSKQDRIPPEQYVEDLGWTPLHFCSFSGYLEVADLLIKTRTNIDAVTSMGMSPLYFASQNGHAKIVKSLLRAGAFVNQQSIIGYAPLTVASGSGHIHVVDLLVQYEADVNHVASDPQKSTPLGEAIDNGHIPVVELLISAGAKVNRPRPDGYSHLFHASTANKKDMTEALLRGGADANQKLPGWITCIYLGGV